eukprot:601056_1
MNFFWEENRSAAYHIALAESKLYLHALCCSDPHLFVKDDDDEKQIYCTLWMDLSFIHNVVRVLLNPQNWDNFCLSFEAKYGGKYIIKIEDSKHRKMFKVWMVNRAIKPVTCTLRVVASAVDEKVSQVYLSSDEGHVFVKIKSWNIQNG